MTAIYVDEKHGSSYGLGVLVVHDEVWRQQFIRLLQQFRPPLMYHATEDRQTDLGRFNDLKNAILRSIEQGLQSSGVIEWQLFAKASEKEAWKSFLDWAYQRYRPTRDNQLLVYRDRGNLRRDTAAMLSGNDRFLVQAKPKVLATETRVDSHKILIGVVDYMLYSGKFF